MRLHDLIESSDDGELSCSLGDLPEKPRIRLSSEKLAGEGFEFKNRTLDEMYDDAFLEYGRALGILPY
jgi:anthocyanidin reductase